MRTQQASAWFGEGLSLSQSSLSCDPPVIAGFIYIAKETKAGSKENRKCLKNDSTVSFSP